MKTAIFDGMTPRAFIMDLFGGAVCETLSKFPRLLDDATEQKKPAVIARVEVEAEALYGNTQSARRCYIDWTHGARSWEKVIAHCNLTQNDFSRADSLAGLLPFNAWGGLDRRIIKGSKSFPMPVADAESLLAAHRQAGSWPTEVLDTFAAQLATKRHTGGVTLPVFGWNQTKSGSF